MKRYTQAKGVDKGEGILVTGSKGGCGMVMILKNSTEDCVKERGIGGLQKDTSDELEASTDIIWFR